MRISTAKLGTALIGIVATIWFLIGFGQTIEGLISDAPLWVAFGLRKGPLIALFSVVAHFFLIKWDRANPKVLTESGIEDELRFFITSGIKLKRRLQRSKFPVRYATRAWEHNIIAFVKHYIPEHRTALTSADADVPPINLPTRRHNAHNRLSRTLTGAMEVMERKFRVVFEDEDHVVTLEPPKAIEVNIVRSNVQPDCLAVRVTNRSEKEQRVYDVDFQLIHGSKPERYGRVISEESQEVPCVMPPKARIEIIFTLSINQLRAYGCSEYYAHVEMEDGTRYISKPMTVPSIAALPSETPSEGRNVDL